ncbi:efflux RND transporter periplasmic adaptor subunit [Aestuariibacter sp. AA17]|uniref:Efflux RND transporter periplasmic adaptor subunit n=1 Tax=Fluctibacter corallii TaxID=2984329 RepID=A0ABT3A7U0_9ALTE|nr:efflux RND transporter periplasmic adaptor subunit [Aestuariibacter sp. AA17]MCV2884742.1 efflux RND transporter periplasmic adaptor subunit [Aestuariibacter sp. AA17]
MKLKPLFASLAFIGVISVMAGCDKQEMPTQAPMAPTVSIAQVINETITEKEDFTGRIETPNEVNLRPRVSGYIDFTAFEEGAFVKEGEPLFFIDNAPFKAEVNRLKAAKLEAQSALELAEKEVKRANNLRKTQAISAEEADNRLARQQQAQARLSSVNAQLELAKLNLSYTRVVAPISGYISKANVTKGNYVKAGETSLTNIVATDKMYVYFDADEKTYLKYVNAKHRTEEDGTALPVFMGLADDESFNYKGTLDFVDNRINATTGTITGRAVFDNTNGELIPGLFARVRLLSENSVDGILIKDKAIGTDLNNKFVLVLADDNTVQYRPIELGEKLYGLRVVKSGLSPEDKIVINGLQRVRPGSKVTPQEATMADEHALAELRQMQQAVERVRSNPKFAAVNENGQAEIGG